MHRPSPLPLLRSRPLSRSLAAAAVFLGIAAADNLPAQKSGPVLTNASDVLSLPFEQVRKHLRVRVTGVVTAAEPQWNGQFFIQDPTGGIFVENHASTHPYPGDRVEVSGTCRIGTFAPIISQPSWKMLGTAPLPEAKSALMEQVMSGSEDSQRVELSGIVRSAEVSSTGLNLDLDIASAGYRFHAFPRRPSGLDPRSLVGASVRVKGTAAASYYPGLRRLVSVNLFMPLDSDFQVLSTEPEDPFQQPATPLVEVSRYERGRRPGQRVHVQGRITFRGPGEDLFIQDSTSGMHINTKQAGNFSVGDVIEAVGFTELESYVPVLQDALVRKCDASLPALAPKAVSLRTVQDGLCHAQLISITGKLLDKFVRSDRLASGPGMSSRTVLLMQNGAQTFTAGTDAPDAPVLFGDVPIGSTLEVTGVCFTEAGADGKAVSFQILMPSAKGVTVLKKPSWWTPPRLFAGLGILLGILLVGAVWAVMMSKKNATLKKLVREKEEAQVELRQAHDQLEERVRERSEQLKLQITARKELELQSKATLAERTRLAQELHDTLEQALLGVALQLEMSSRLFDNESGGAKTHLDVARTLVAESQNEVHRSVWNLRCRALEQFDLPGALLMSSNKIAGHSQVEVNLTSRGRVRPLPEIVEENLLRIAQEALTNVIKHSGATRAEIELDYGPRNVVLQISDNGRGFVLNGQPGPREGHFGLLGISERAKRLQGEIAFAAGPNRGTTIRVQIPIPLDADSAENGRTQAA